MNTKFVKIALLFGGLLALATSLSAETALVTVNVPFAFVAGGKELPAGSYTIEEPSKSGVLIIRGSAPKSTVVVLAVKQDSRGDKAEVTFNRAGSEVLLSSVEVPYGATYSLLSTEHKLATTVAVPSVALRK